MKIGVGKGGTRERKRQNEDWWRRKISKEVQYWKITLDLHTSKHWIHVSKQANGFDFRWPQVQTHCMIIKNTTLYKKKY